MVDKINPRVFAIVLNYKGKASLLACLDSLYKSDYPSLDIIVIDNDSKDGSLEDAREKFPRFHFIKNSENLGFAAGNNVAIRFALEKMADYIFLLNNDATVNSDTISKMVAAAEEDSLSGILSPVIFSPDNNQIWFAGGKILWQKMKTQHLNKICSDIAYETDYISGCAMLVKKAVFKKIGLFDENFFLYYEDADLSYRAKKAGFTLKIVPSALAYHAEQSEHSNPQKLYWLVISGIIFFKKNATGLLKLWIFFYLLLRKIKNFITLKTNPNEEKLEVRRAYRNFKKFLR